MTDIRLQAVFRRVEEAIEKISSWTMVPGAPDNCDVYRASYKGIQIFVGGHPHQEAVVDGVVTFPEFKGVIRLTRPIAQRALERAREARKASAS